MPHHRLSSILPLVASLVLGSACVAEIGDSADDCGVQCDNHRGIAGEGVNWEEQFVSLVDEEYQSLSTYASTEGGWGACVSTWTVGGAVIGELASKTCVVVGVAAFETGVGAVAAAVCVGADVAQADAVLGAAAGYVSGYIACSASSIFSSFTSDYRVFDVGTDGESGVEDADEVESWNTPECAAAYDDYKAVCGQSRSCRAQGLTCEDYIERYDINTQCAFMRQSHLYDCPHPDDFNWESHESEVGEAFLAAQTCQTELCQASSCALTIVPELYSAYDSICLL